MLETTTLESGHVGEIYIQTLPDWMSVVSNKFILHCILAPIMPYISINYWQRNNNNYYSNWNRNKLPCMLLLKLFGSYSRNNPSQRQQFKIMNTWKPETIHTWLINETPNWLSSYLYEELLVIHDIGIIPVLLLSMRQLHAWLHTSQLELCLRHTCVYVYMYV